MSFKVSQLRCIGVYSHVFYLAISAKGNNLCKFLFASKGEKQSLSETRGFTLNEIISP